MSTLAIKLKTLMKEQGLTVGELEHRAGLRMSAVKNILSGQSKKPSAETLLSISRVLGCTIQELLGEPIDDLSSPTIAKANEGHNQVIENLPFFVKTTEVIASLIENNYAEKTLTFSELNKIIREVYSYSLKNSFPDIDVKFAEWIIER